MHVFCISSTDSCTPLQFSKYVHMHASILPLEQLRQIVLVAIQLVCVGNNLTRCIWHQSHWPKARPHWLSDILNINFEVDSTGSFEDKETEA